MLHTFLGFDTETTGVNPQTDRIVTAALVMRQNSTDTVETWLADPGVEIPEAAAKVHGISTDYARTHGRPIIEVLEEVATYLTQALAANIPVVAFNASYDLQIIESELARHGLPTITARLGRPLSPVLDPLVLDRMAVKIRRGKRRLEDLCNHYGVVADPDQLHTAEVDVIATLDLLEKQFETHSFMRENALEELHKMQIQGHRAWAEDFNAWRVSRGFSGPGAGLNWPI